MMPDTTDESQQQLLRSRELVFVTINLLNSKLIEVQSAAQGSLSRFVLIDEPVEPTSPANKGMLFIMLLGLVAGLFLAGGGIFLYDMIDNRLELVSDFEKFYSMPLLGTILHKRAEQDYYVNPATRSASYHSRNEMGEIVVNIKQALKDPNKKLFSVCSPVRKEGKSMISVQLATALADKNLKVLLVDMDMFIPKLTNRLGRADNIGLINYLRGENTLDEILVPIETPGFYFTGVGNTSDRSDFFYDDPNFINFTQEVKAKFDIVIFDTPAVLHIPDIITFMDLMDGVLIIARLAHTSRKSLDRLLKMIGIHRSKITGVIVNDLKLNMVNKYTDHYHYAYEYNYNEEGKKVKKRKKSESGELQVA
jgi:Mrp family chromosome partitioning ATPase